MKKKLFRVLRIRDTELSLNKLNRREEKIKYNSISENPSKKCSCQMSIEGQNYEIEGHVEYECFGQLNDLCKSFY